MEKKNFAIGGILRKIGVPMINIGGREELVSEMVADMAGVNPLTD